MADKGNRARFMFAGTSYSTADCLSGFAFNNSITDIVYQCAGYDKHLAGTQQANFNISLGLGAADTTSVIALAPGTSSTQFEANPGGYTTGYIEISSTKALITSANISAPMNGIISMDVTFVLDNVTLTTA